MCHQSVRIGGIFIVLKKVPQGYGIIYAHAHEEFFNKIGINRKIPTQSIKKCSYLCHRFQKHSINDLKLHEIMEKELKISFALESNVLGLERLNRFEIEVKHRKRDYGSAFNGITVSVTPLEEQEWNGHKIFGHVYDGNWQHQGFWVAIESCARKSPKKMENYFEKIKPYAEEIKDLFIKGEDKAILCLLRGVCLGTLNVK